MGCILYRECSLRNFRFNLSFRLFLILSLSFFLGYSSAISAEELTVKYIDSPVELVPLVVVQPLYPSRALDRGREGYVIVNFIIDRDGKPVNPVIVESTDSIFEKAALNAAKKLRYEPIIENGLPVEINHFYKFTWELVDNQKFEKFEREYKKFQKYLYKNDQAGALEALEKLETNHGSLVYGYKNLANYYYLSNFEPEAIHEQLYYLEHAAKPKNEDQKEYYLEDKFLRIAFSELFRLQAENKFYNSALHTYERMELKGFKEEAKFYRATKDAILEFKESDQAYSVPLITDSEGNAYIFLFRREFALDDENGVVNELMLSCENKNAQMSFIETSSYLIPDSWGMCHLTIMGAPESHVTYIQY